MGRTRIALPLSAILLLALGLRLGSFWAVYRADPTRIIRQDSLSYENPARALAQTGRFAVSPDRPNQLEVVRTPGYPLFIALIYSLFGERRGALIAAQILLSVGTIFMTWRLGRQLMNEQAALVGALILAIDPLSFLYSQLMLSETLFTFFVLAGGLACVKLLAGEGKEIGWGLLLGLAIALATFVRPVSYYLIFPLTFGLLVARKVKTGGWQKSLTVAVAALLPWLVLVGGWQLRNRQATGRAEFCFIQGYSLLRYRAAGIVALRDGISLEEAQEKLVAALPDIKGWPAAQVSDLFRREGLSLIRRYPGLCLKTQAIGVASMLLGPGGGTLNEYVGQWIFNKPFKVTILFYQVIFLILLYGGIILFFARLKTEKKEQWPTHLALWGIVLYLIVLSAGPEAYSRFRVPLMPIFSLYAGAGFASFLRFLRRRRGPVIQAVTPALRPGSTSEE